jgi:hypothetical protein
MATKEALALRLLIMEINPEIVKEPTVIMTDSAGALALSMTQARAKSRHLALKIAFIQEKVRSNEIEIQRVSGVDNVADIFTKVLPGPRFKILRDIMMDGVPGKTNSFGTEG